MKINIYDAAILDNNHVIKLAKKIKRGITTGLLVSMIGATSVGCGAKSNLVSTETELENLMAEPITVDIDDINQLNVIINDNDCSNSFINNICEELNHSGLDYQLTHDGENIDVDNSVVITLDQQYISGPGMVVLAPYENDRLGNSDALALSMHTAFDSNGFFTDGIFCGKVGYREGGSSITTRVPTSTEEGIGKDKNTSFTTICFGTENAHAGLVKDSILEGLARYYEWGKEHQNEDVDLIYCVRAGDTLSQLAEKFKTTPSELNKAAGLDYDNSIIQLNQTLFNPNEIKDPLFDKLVTVEVAEKTNTIKIN